MTKLEKKLIDALIVLMVHSYQDDQEGCDIAHEVMLDAVLEEIPEAKGIHKLMQGDLQLHCPHCNEGEWQSCGLEDGTPMAFGDCRHSWPLN